MIKKEILKPEYPVIDNKVKSIIDVLRHQRIPVSMNLIPTQALETAKAHNITDFKARRGWVEKFIRRFSI